ncbi:ImmA/IrrE family metallo-endopeptidase [Lactiplantibacillus sp. WILCCON 0030]|uniref:ImmA/IrrE family metallo-endopeptidase n=1 Tax=Lactiplantibacillus brownii TaxID=3069269 RepID=A0ABU1A860_9LACO|nr:ImmA/IrrE family metallo-endopeptidase [Lactiplantibacillus brownii]MDQ7937063.1 ImmA/IrrE family metallo-endopeptidase [Lactiplantibacillus brownii]
MNEYLGRALEYAVDHGISYDLCEDFSPYTPSGSNPETNKIVINMNWYLSRQLPYVTCHEISHIEHQDSGILYFHTISKTPIEAEANKGAINILVPMYFESVNVEDANAYTFMQEFDVPPFMEDYTIDAIHKFYKKEVPYNEDH